MALMAMALHEELEQPVDIGRVLKIILVHDLAEIRAGDYHAFKEVPHNKYELELKALQEIVKPLPKKLQAELIELWEEFEARTTLEAKFAVALDKLEVLIQHNEAELSTWEAKEFDFNLTYGDDKVAYSQTLKDLRKIVLEECVEKVDAAR
jgi:putative hydrolase of HD superfamily